MKQFQLSQVIILAYSFIFAAPLFAGERVIYIHPDHRGAPILMTYSGGAPVWKGQYLPFGKLFSETSRAGETHHIRLFNSFYDSGTGLIHMPTGKYSPELGRYINIAGARRDFFKDINPYIFKKNNPIKKNAVFSPVKQIAQFNSKLTRSSAYGWADNLNRSYKLPNPLQIRKLYWKDKRGREKRYTGKLGTVWK